MMILSIFNNFQKIRIFPRTLTSARRSWVKCIGSGSSSILYFKCYFKFVSFLLQTCLDCSKVQLGF